MSGKYSAPFKRPAPAAILAFAALACAVLPLSVLASCSRGKGVKGAVNTILKAPSVVEPLPQALAPPPTRVQPAPAPAGKPAPVPVRILAAPMAASMRALGLRAASAPRIARDFSLGPLQSWRPAAGDEKAVFAAATSFLDGLAAGKLDKALLLPSARDALAVLLAPPAPVREGSGKASAYRLGAILIQDDQGSLRVRLPSLAGDAREEGLLSLRKVGESWYIEALALEPPASAALAFNPDTSAGPR
jgi:hypothetical protein